MAPENLQLLKFWIRAIIEESWKLPPERVMDFIDEQFEILEDDFNVRLHWNELRTVTIEELEEGIKAPPRRLRLVK